MVRLLANECRSVEAVPDMIYMGTVCSSNSRFFTASLSLINSLLYFREIFMSAASFSVCKS